MHSNIECGAETGAAIPSRALTLLCATPKSGLVISAPCWPNYDTQMVKIERGDAAMVLAHTVENSDRFDRGTILVAAKALLGQQALAAHARDVARITNMAGPP